MQSRNILVIMAAATLALASCGTSASSASGGKGTIRIGIDLPLSGGDQSAGVSAENGALLAIAEANGAGGLDGYKIAAFPLDDASPSLGNPQQGATNVQKFIADGQVLAMVGPLTSNVARTEMPLASSAALVMISPSATADCLTQAHNYCTNGEPASLHPDGKTDFFRTCTTNSVQGLALADFAIKQGYRNVYVLDDGDAYGKGIADSFAAELTARGGTIAAHDEFDPSSTRDFKSFLTKAKSKSVDLVMFGGTSSNGGGILRLQMKTSLPGLPYFGGDAIADNQFIQDAGSNADGSTYTVAAADAGKLVSPQPFLTNFRKVYTRDTDYGMYTANMYDATKIVIAALDHAIKAASGKLPSREAIRIEIARTDYIGVTGRNTFDANGDTGNKIISLYRLTGAVPRLVDQISF
jgi:branched-chain amino acid transport system substrate-binding protein